MAKIEITAVLKFTVEVPEEVLNRKTPVEEAHQRYLEEKQKIHKGYVIVP